MGWFAYPEAKKDEEASDDFQGKKVPNPYIWLEDLEAKETKDYVNSQYLLTRNYIDTTNFRAALKKEVTKLFDYKKYYLPNYEGLKVYQWVQNGLEQQPVLYEGDSPVDLLCQPKVTFNPNTHLKSGPIAVSEVRFSKDGKKMAYSVQLNGSDWHEIRFYDLECKKDLEDVLAKVKYTYISWTAQSDGIFYSSFLELYLGPAGTDLTQLKFHKVFYHRLGTAQKKDIAVAYTENPFEYIYGRVSDCGGYLVCHSYVNLVYKTCLAADLRENGPIKGQLNMIPLANDYEADYHYVTNMGRKFILHTNREAPKWRVIVVDFKKPQEGFWETLVPEHDSDVLVQVKPVNCCQMVLLYLRDVTSVLCLFCLRTGKKIKEIPTEVGFITELSCKRDHKDFFFRISSFLNPGQTYRVNLASDGSGGCACIPEVYQENKLKGFNPKTFIGRKCFYESNDGTRIPMFIFHKRITKKTGTNPCLLFVYGAAMGINYPVFSLLQMSFVQSFNGVFAVANVRGGGEYGSQWHEKAANLCKSTTMQDIKYACKFLIEQNFTSQKKLCLMGYSHGATAVACCVNQIPELFSACICTNGIYDLFKFNQFTYGATWEDEYGNPGEEEHFRNLWKFSPMHNIKAPKGDLQTPAILFNVGYNDDRVVPFHTFKFITALQQGVGQMDKQRKPFFLRVETDFGHGPKGKNTSKKIYELVDLMCFIGRALNLKYKQCPCKKIP